MQRPRAENDEQQTQEDRSANVDGMNNPHKNVPAKLPKTRAAKLLLQQASAASSKEEKKSKKKSKKDAGVLPDFGPDAPIQKVDFGVKTLQQLREEVDLFI